MEKRIGHRVMGKLIAAAAVGLAGFGAVQQADAALIIDVRATTVNGTPVAPSKSVQILPGQSVGLELWAKVNGANTAFDEKMQSAMGNLVSTGSLLGNLSADQSTGFGGFLANFTGSGAQDGKIQDIDGDGDLDVGTPIATQVNTDFFNARSNSPVDLTAANAGFAPQYIHTLEPGTAEVLIGLGTFVASATAAGETFINFVNRVNADGSPSSAGAVWYEDGVVMNPTVTGAVFGVGTPVNVTLIPEPTGLALAGLASIGLLARRRNNAK